MGTFSIDADILPPITDIISPSTTLLNTDRLLSESCLDRDEAVIAGKRLLPSDDKHDRC